jgi:3-deoxy-D-manno-octulosonic acid kinase
MPSSRLEERGYEPLRLLREGRRQAWVLAAEVAHVGPALLRGTGCVEDPGTGRAPVQRFPLSQGEGILRTYHRGGLARHVLPDGYFFSLRPLKEFLVHRRAYALGLAVPRPLGVCWERRGGVLRGCIATQALPGPTLYAAIAGDPAGASDVLRATGQVVRQLHDAGIWHADLQVRNVLLTPEGPHLIDFDQARATAGLDDRARARNLLRFRRSLDKNFGSAGYFGDFLGGYGTVHWPLWLDGAYRFRGRFSDLFGGSI